MQKSSCVYNSRFKITIPLLSTILILPNPIDALALSLPENPHLFPPPYPASLFSLSCDESYTLLGY